MKNKLPTIKVLKIMENPDGSANIAFDVSDGFKRLVREKTNVKRVSKKRLNAFILQVLTDAIYNRNGWGFQKDTK